MRFFNKRVPADYHTGPIYYYIPRLIAYLFPWCLLLPTLIGKIQGRLSQQEPLKIFLWLWFLIPFILFSLSDAKGDYYMVLGCPALALLLGLKLNDDFRENKTRLLNYLVITVTFALPLMLAYLLYFQSQLLPPQLITTLEITLLGLLGYALVASIVCYKSTKTIVPFMFLAALIIPFSIFVVSGRQTLQNNYSEIKIGQYIRSHDQNRRVFLYQDYEKISSVLFYARKRMAMIDSTSHDLWYGSKSADAKGWFINLPDFVRFAKENPVYVILIQRKLVGFIKDTQPIKLCPVARSDNVYLMSNRCKS